MENLNVVYDRNVIFIFRRNVQLKYEIFAIKKWQNREIFRFGFDKKLEF